jgi:hypothetical protein
MNHLSLAQRAAVLAVHVSNELAPRIHRHQSSRHRADPSSDVACRDGERHKPEFARARLVVNAQGGAETLGSLK